MKKTALLNIALSRTIAGLGHGDILVIGDAGLPVPAGVELIDLAVTPGLPDFASVLRVVVSEMQVERHVLAEEIFQVAPPGLAEVEALFGQGLLGGRERMPHNEFKALSGRAKVIVRTGECKPYSNIALIAGVTF
ncbi:D-ribose pyranase [Pseudomonas reidholzensis]|uniref:D-ribose pyranase n=1 Tax=Pseudomonas reidholzensis TaxID=1785162 RepID=A0A383RSN0_9PSED|nr:D-ribose pyranase [Pseudomonas reidholzensis]SYX89885.1 D-ribose pyranase [Pseudomonas reidholzensis]